MFWFSHASQHMAAFIYVYLLENSNRLMQTVTIVRANRKDRARKRFHLIYDIFYTPMTKKSACVCVWTFVGFVAIVRNFVLLLKNCSKRKMRWSEKSFFFFFAFLSLILEQWAQAPLKLTYTFVCVFCVDQNNENNGITLTQVMAMNESILKFNSRRNSFILA